MVKYETFLIFNSVKGRKYFEKLNAAEAVFSHAGINYYLNVIYIFWRYCILVLLFKKNN